MSTFCAVDDATLIALIRDASKRIVFIAPGVHELVAKALGERFRDIDGLDVTVVLDPDEDVCRNGYGDISGLELVHQYAQKNGFWVRSQAGLRVGVLLADDKTLVWSPTPRSIEAPPTSVDTQKIQAQAEPKQVDLPAPSTTVQPMAPNGLLLGSNPGEQLAKAVAAEGVNADPRSAEIGKSAITPEQLKVTKEAIERNPVIPVDLARVTRVFSTKLQFVDLEISGAKVSDMDLTIPDNLLNADVTGDLQELIRSRLRPFLEFKTVEVAVPAYHNGKLLEGRDGKAQIDNVSQATLQRTRTALERKYIYDITGYGRLIARDEKTDFEAHVEALKVQLLAHSKALKQLIAQQSTEIVDEAVHLIMERARRAGNLPLPDPKTIHSALLVELDRRKFEEPKVKLVFKDVTYEQTKSDDFRKRVERALPPPKRKQLGSWSEHFVAAREASAQNDEKGKV